MKCMINKLGLVSFQLIFFISVCSGTYTIDYIYVHI